MTLLTIAVSVAAPALANFFRGRTLDSEARRLLALTRSGQSRAVSEGVPVELWIDSAHHRFGLEAEPSYEPEDPKALAFDLDQDMTLEVGTLQQQGRLVIGGLNARPASPTAGRGAELSRHPDLPRIRFLPDGSIGENSPTALRLARKDGATVWLAQTQNRLSYELRTRQD